MWFKMSRSLSFQTSIFHQTKFRKWFNIFALDSIRIFLTLLFQPPQKWNSVHLIWDCQSSWVSSIHGLIIHWPNRNNINIKFVTNWSEMGCVMDQTFAMMRRPLTWLYFGVRGVVWCKCALYSSARIGFFPALVGSFPVWWFLCITSNIQRRRYNFGSAWYSATDNHRLISLRSEYRLSTWNLQ